MIDDSILPTAEPRPTVDTGTHGIGYGWTMDDNGYCKYVNQSSGIGQPTVAEYTWANFAYDPTVVVKTFTRPDDEAGFESLLADAAVECTRVYDGLYVQGDTAKPRTLSYDSETNVWLMSGYLTGEGYSAPNHKEDRQISVLTNGAGHSIMIVCNAWRAPPNTVKGPPEPNLPIKDLWENQLSFTG